MTRPSQHGGLTPERWADFSRAQQLMMIANEMNRVRRLVGRGEADKAVPGYERTLRLTDLTIAANPRRGFLKEILRWRELVAQLYLDSRGGRADAATHDEALRALLLLSIDGARQIRWLLRG